MAREIDPQEAMANLSLDVIRNRLKDLEAKVDSIIGHLESISSEQGELRALLAELIVSGGR